MTRLARVFASWIAAVSMAVAALAPSISHALAGERGAPWLGVCSLVKAAGHAPLQRDDTGGHHHLDDCPYCSFHAHAVAILGDPVVLAPASIAVALVPAAFLEAPRTPHAWVSAQPRGPPPAG